MSQAIQQLPPGPSQNFFASLWLFYHVVKKPYDALLRLQEKYGDTFAIRTIGTGVTVFTGNPDHVKDVFAMSPDHFTMMDTPRIEFFFGRRSLFTSEGETHRRDKKLIFPHFRGERMRAYADTIVECTRKLCNQNIGKGTVSLLDVAQATTIEVMLQALLGVRRPEHLKEISDVFMGWNAAQNPLLGIPFMHNRLFKPYREFVHYNQELCRFVQVLIEENRAGDGGTDILSLMVRSQYEDGTFMEDEHITDHMKTLLVAGFDTTANAITWGMDTIFRTPELLRKLREELDSMPEDASLDDMSNLPLLDATCYEMMRLNPPLEMIPTRKLSKPLQMGPYLLPAGYGVMACPIMTQRHSEVYPNPDEFRPERFLGKRPNVFEYFPFGGGRRLCAGYAFANYQLRLVIGTAIKEYDFDVVGQAPKAKRYSVVVGPGGNTPTIVSKRST